MTNVVITGTGLYTPEHAIDNASLVAAFNAWVDQENARNADAIERGSASRWPIQAASSLKKRRVSKAAMC